MVFKEIIHKPEFCAKCDRTTKHETCFGNGVSWIECTECKQSSDWLYDMDLDFEE